MAITQQRVVAMLRAADELEAYYHSVKSVVKRVEGSYFRNEIDAHTALVSLCNQLVELPLSLDQLLTLTREREHFIHSGKRNEYMRNYMREVRAGRAKTASGEIEFMPPASSTPKLPERLSDKAEADIARLVGDVIGDKSTD